MWAEGDKVSTSLFFSHTSILRSFFSSDLPASLRIDALIRLTFDRFSTVCCSTLDVIRFTPRTFYHMPSLFLSVDYP
jgi:hypothetical protein